MWQCLHTLRSLPQSDNIFEYHWITVNTEGKGGTVVNVKHKRKSTLLGIVIILLLLCEIASLAVLFDRMSIYSKAEFQNIIPLNESKNSTNVTITTREKINFENLSEKNYELSEEPRIIKLSAPSFSTFDENTVWQAETDIEIFRLFYNNDKNEITVKGNNNNINKLIAPGTSNKYMFTLENSGNAALDYIMTMEAWITGTEYSIPIKVSVWDYTNKYLLGDSINKKDVLELNNVKEKGILGSGRYAVYNLEWEWPFEQGNDEYDTMLGNLAVDNELALTVKINTTATYNNQPEADNSGLSKPPQTGENTALLKTLSIVLGTAFILAVISFLSGIKRNNDDSEE